MFLDTGRDKMAVVQAFENYVSQFPRSVRIGDAQFMIGEASMQHALSILKSEAKEKKNSTARLLAPKNPAAVKALQNARQAFMEVASDRRTGIGPSAQYRLGEVAYNEKDWARAVEEWKQVEKKFPKSYVVGESLMGIIFADLALEQFSGGVQLVPSGRDVSDLSQEPLSFTPKASSRCTRAITQRGEIS